MVLEYNHNHDHQHHIHDHGHHQHHHYHHAGIINTASHSLLLRYFWASWSLINKDKQIIDDQQKMTVLERCYGNSYIQPGWRPYLKSKMFLLCFSSDWGFLRGTVFLNTVNLDNSMHWDQKLSRLFLLNNHQQ